METEIKLRLSDASEMRRKLEAAGFDVHQPRALERNLVFDTEESALRQRGELLRVRSFAGRSILTFKGPVVPDVYKSREELEIDLSSGQVFEEILRRLGYRQAFVYEKFRTEYAKPGSAGVVTIDETPIGNFMEMEGQPDWIDTTARQLGFTRDDYVTASYAALFRMFRSGNPGAPNDMVFSPS